MPPPEVATEPQQSTAPQDQRSFKAECQGCHRMVTRRSRRALTWRCPHCKRVNPGPGLTEEMAKPPDPAAGGRRRRRRAAADRAGDPAASTPAPAAPVRRKRSAPAAAAPAPASAPAAQASPPPRRGLLDRILYGEGDDDGD